MKMKTMKAPNIEKLAKETERWPKSWAGFDSDVPVGQQIVKAMYPFLSALMKDGYSKTTINRHVNNLWLLGGEIIRCLNTDTELKVLSGEELILRFVDEEGGPYSRHIDTEKEQKVFDSTCRKLYRFLSKQPDRK